MKIISLLLIASFIFAFEDLGTYGSTHIIAEKNFMDEINMKSKDLNSTLLQKQLMDGEKKYMQVDRLLPTCKKTQQRFFTPTFVVPADVILPDGRVIARAGDVMNTLDVLKKNHITIDKYMMFIDADDDVQVELSYMYKNQGQTFITNGSIREYEKLTKIQSFKADRVVIEKFGAKCSPSLIIQKNDKLVIYEYNPQEIAQGDE